MATLKPFDPSVYQDGEKSPHAMEGTVVPPATSRKNVTKLHVGDVSSGVSGGMTAGKAGVTFNVKAPYPYNVVDLETQEVMKVTPEEHLLYLKINKEAQEQGAPVVTLKEMKEAQKRAEIQVQIESEKSADVKSAEEEAAEEDEALLATAIANSDLPQMVDPQAPRRRRRVKGKAVDAPIIPQVISKPVVAFNEASEKVRFSGTFGSLSVMYNYVRKDGIFLVLTQCSKEKAFYEVPVGTEAMLVEHKGNRYKCLPGPEFRLTDSGDVQISVLFITED